MSEHMSPIPSRLYNAAVGGHVAGADQIIDDETGLTLDKIAGGALEEKEYTSGSNNGMGRVVLRKNLVEGVNTLTQSMINKSNTIYVIQYDFTLASDVSIPANCVLEFDGGSISGAYTLTGNNTGIKAGLVKIFTTDITTNGSWNIGTVYPEWFGAVGDGEVDDTDAIKKVLKEFRGYKIVFSYGKTYPGSFCTPVYSNTEIVIDGTLTSARAEGISLEFFDRVTETPGYTGVHDVIIRGRGTIDAKAEVYHTPHSPLRIHHCRNITIKDITCKGYGVWHFLESGGTDGLTIDNCTFYSGYNWEGSQTDSHEVNEAIQLESIDEGSTSGAIPYDGTVTRNVNIKNCKFITLTESPILSKFVGNHVGDAVYNVIIDNCKFYGLNTHPKSRCIFFEGSISNLDIRNCHFEDFQDENSVVLGLWNAGQENALTDIKIQNCFFKNTAGICIQFCKDVYIDNNKFVRTIDYSSSKQAVTINNVNTDVIITNNIFNNIHTYCILLTQNSTLTDIRISDNKFAHINVSPIYCYANSGTKTRLIIKNNCFEEWGLAGAEATAFPAIIVYGNKIYRSAFLNNFFRIDTTLQRLPVHATAFGETKPDVLVKDNVIYGLSVLTSQHIEWLEDNIKRFEFNGNLFKADANVDIENITYQ